jgi:hypothetical protein
MSELTNLINAMLQSQTSQDANQLARDKMTLDNMTKMNLAEMARENQTKSDSTRIAGQKEIANNANTSRETIATDANTNRKSISDAQIASREKLAKDADNKRLLGDLSQMTNMMRSSQIEEDIADYETRYQSLLPKIQALNSLKQMYQMAKPRIGQLEKQLIPFFSESGLMGFDESEVIDSYETARQGEGGLEAIVNAVKGLPADDSRKGSVIDLLTRMQNRFAEPAFNFISDATVGDELSDGDIGPLGGDDPQGARGKAMMEEVTNFIDLLNNYGDVELDAEAGITPKSREFINQYPSLRRESVRDKTKLYEDNITIISNMIEALNK